MILHKGIFKRGNDSPVHYVHKYPAKFIPAIPRWFIQNLSSEGDVVLDPFCGSGTTVVEAQHNGRRGICVDVSPIAQLISRVKTTPLPPETPKIIDQVFTQIKSDVGEGADVTPPTVDNVDYWFTPNTQHQLGIINQRISEVSDPTIRDFLRVGLSATVRSVSKIQQKQMKPRRDRNFVEKDTVAKFQTVITKNLDRLQDLDGSYGINVVKASASDLPIPDESIDLIVTDPPYSRWSIPYAEMFKFEMMWDGHNYATARKENWGEFKPEQCQRNDTDLVTVKKLYDQMDGTNRDKKKCSVLNFSENISDAVSEMYRVLKPDGFVVIRIGNPNTKINGQWVEIPNNEILEEIIQKTGFVIKETFTRGVKSVILPKKRVDSGNTIKREYYFVLKKSKGARTIHHRCPQSYRC